MNLSNENVIHIKKGNVEYLQFRRLLEYSDDIQHLYSLGLNRNFRTLKNVGDISSTEYNQALRDYKDFTKEIGGNEKQVVKPIQRHTGNIEVINAKINKDRPDICNEKYDGIDGLITSKKEIILSTTNADCILMLFFDPVKKVIANVHSGWKGTIQRISVNTINKMQKEYNCDVKDIICCICPSIRKCHFEVEKDVKDIFENEYEELLKNIENNKYVNCKRDDIILETKKNKKWNIDTVLINKIILQEIGIKEENIIDSGICSVCQSNIIHSYRKEKEGFGLNTAMIKLN